MDDTAEAPQEKHATNSFQKELTELINRYSVENESDTPDFVLAQYIGGCLTAFNRAIRLRDKWFRFKPFEKGIEN